uniref:Transferrin-like domain-containing protein n=1 Tax=Scylla olivacea TaxID=85551 RepID=A0A0N7ZB72_SCYOL
MAELPWRGQERQAGAAKQQWAAETRGDRNCWTVARFCQDLMMAVVKAVMVWMGLLLLWGFPVAIPKSQPLFPQTQHPVSLCVEAGTDCSHLTQVSGGILNCIAVRDRLDCLKKMRNREADIGYFEAEDLKVAALFFGNEQEVVLQAFSKDEVQHAYLLVHNASNPKPKSLCHPGLHLHRSYPRALYRPITLDSDAFLPDIKAHIEKLSEAWTSACIPGPWSLDPATDLELKQQHPHLCHACLRQTCHADDPYAGSGALTCLLDHAADAAIVSDVDLRKLRVTNHDVERLFHYCRGNNGGSIQPLGDLTGLREEPCNWGKRPVPVFMFASSCNTTECQRSIQVLAIQAHAVVEALRLPQKTQITRLDRPLTPSAIIEKAGYTIDDTSIQKVVKFCTRNEDEMAKCEDLAMVTQAFDAGSGIGIGCVQERTNWFSHIYFGSADVITLDSGDVFKFVKDFGFQRLLSEVYDTKSGRYTSSYYAVAVVRADSNITSFIQLRGRKSCHTGIDKTAGWKLPVATLLNLGLINPQHCNYVDAMAEFFSNGSCAPGANNPMYNAQKHYVDRLCSLCIGEGTNKCLRGGAEPFYSYTGAFRCLVHGGGDVSFIKHTTVPDNTDGSNNEEWAMSLRSDDFRLLCPSYGGANTAAVNEYQTCNLALVPAHEVVSRRMSDDRKKMVRQALLGVSEVFGKTSPGLNTFRLFGRYNGKSDLLFKDSAKGLKALSEDTQDERKRKKDYFKKLEELHTCEVRVCALEDYENECEEMARTMKGVGEQFVCVSARDRMDCVQRVIEGQADMSILPGSYLSINSNLRIIAYSKDPRNARDHFRYKAVMVVRRSTVHRKTDLRGKKSCHTGYGRTTGWRIPIALLKREGIIHPLCEPFQSTLEHEIKSVATTFNRACIPGEWATTPDVDAALKMRYDAMCSMCSGRTCDRNDDYAGYVGALNCLSFNGGDVAFSKLSIVKQFFEDNVLANVSNYGLMCPDGSVVDIYSSAAEACFWAARPWDTFVTHGGASDAKVQKITWALMQAKRKGEENLANNRWYYNILEIDDTFSDILPAIDNATTGQYLSESRMNIVQAEEMCTSEAPVTFCVSSDEERKKCNDLSSLLHLRGVSPELRCTQGSDVDDCLEMIKFGTSDVMTLTNSKRNASHSNYSLADLLTESYGRDESNLYYFVAVVKKGSGINSVYDLAGKTTCNTGANANRIDYIDAELTNCLHGGAFFSTITDAIKCLMGSSRDVAFVRLDAVNDGNWDDDIKDLNPENFELLCEAQVMSLSSWSVQECNLGRIPGNMLVTRQSESRARKENMRHLFLKASKMFGHSRSFFRLFYTYFSHKDLMFKDVTGSLVRVTDTHHKRFVDEMLKYACNLYEHHTQSEETTH